MQVVLGDDVVSGVDDVIGNSQLIDCEWPQYTSTVMN